MLEWIKTHPLYDVLIGGALFVVFYLIFRSGSGSAAASSGSGGVTYVQSGPSDAVQTASIAASAQQSQTQAALTANAQNVQAQFQLGTAALDEKAIEAQLGSQVSLAQTAAAASVANYGASVQQNIAESQAAAQVQMNADAINGQVAVAGYSAATTIQTTHDNNLTQQAIAQAQLQGWQSQIAAGVAQNQSNNDAAVATANINANATTAIAGINAGVQTAGIDATKAVNLANIEANQNVNLANINAGQTVDLANINAGVQVAGIQGNLYSQYLQTAGSLATQQESDAFNESQYQTSVQQQYLTQLTQLKAYNKDISGLPGTGVTQGEISAAQPGNTTGGILAGIGSLIAGVGKGIGSAFTGGVIGGPAPAAAYT